jgi:septal ring factor EnvC (AmiA/AmiB activator)
VVSAMTPEREQEIRELAEMSGPDSAIAHAVTELDRLRAELAEVRADATAKIKEAAGLAHNARAELAARPTRAQTLREAAQRLGDAFESEGRPGEGDTVDWCADELRRMADAAERGES